MVIFNTFLEHAFFCLSSYTPTSFKFVFKQFVSDLEFSGVTLPLG